MQPMSDISSKKAIMEWDSCPECMNDGKTNFTFSLMYPRESSYFKIMFLWHVYGWLCSS